MKLCVPTQDPRGLEAEISAHFGRAPFYTLVSLQTGEVEVVANPRSAEGHGGCAAWRALGLAAGDVVACRHLGGGAQQALQQAGVAVVMTEAADVEATLAMYRAGELRPLPADALCAGGHHHH